ncbi:MAG: hypothetical protein FD125_192 [bacterium]|nr:MAG: hypothetical protein FD125_192 [bacterium]
MTRRLIPLAALKPPEHSYAHENRPIWRGSMV